MSLFRKILLIGKEIDISKINDDNKIICYLENEPIINKFYGNMYVLGHTYDSSTKENIIAFKNVVEEIPLQILIDNEPYKLIVPSKVKKLPSTFFDNFSKHLYIKSPIFIETEYYGETVKEEGVWVYRFGNPFNKKILTCLEIGGDVTKLGKGSLSRLTVDTLILHEGIETIGYGALNNVNVVEFFIPKSLKTISNDSGTSANYASFFSSCDTVHISDLESFNNIDFAKGISVMHKICLNGEEIKEVTIPEGQTVLKCQYAASTIEKINLPNSITEIKANALTKSNIFNINLPNNLITIGDGAFSSCLNITNVDIPEQVEVIGARLFASCTELISVNISNKITEIKEETFKDCEKLENCNIGDGVKTIGTYAFENCKNFKTINLNNVETLGNLVFRNAKAEILNIPNLKNIGTRLPFEGFSCDTVYINGDILSNNKNANVVGHNWNLFGADEKAYKAVFKKVIIGDNPIAIGTGMFKNLFLEEIIIGENIKIIETNAFSNCVNLKTVTFLTKYIERFGYTVFAGCESLEHITIPDIFEMPGGAFSECTNLKTVTFEKNIDHTGIGGGGDIFDTDSISYIDLSNMTTIPYSIGNYPIGFAKGLLIVPNALYDEIIVHDAWKYTNYKSRIVGITTPCKFNVEENYCIVESGYTWEQYINSKFCNFAFTIVDGVVMIDETNNVQLNGTNVLATDVIENVEYSILINQ